MAVISLPAGVFNPYSGVKTSILILDKSLAKKTDKIAFFKVENDGFSLGAQRRAVEGDDLPFVLEQIRNYELRITKGEELITSEDDRVLIVPKSRIAANGEYNLSGERYRDAIITNNSFPLVQLENVFKLSSGRGLTQSNMKEGIYPVYGGNGKVGTHSEYFLEEPNIIIGRVGAYCGAVHITEPKSWITDNALYITEYKQEIDQHYLAKALTQLNLNRFAKVGGQPSISQTTVYECKIPLPPIAIQKEIVTEIEGYQKVINGARAVIDNYRPHIAIDPDWEMVELGKIAEIIMGQSPAGETYNAEGKGVPLINGPVEFGPHPFSKTIINQYTTAPNKMCQVGDLILCVRGSTTGRMNIAGYEGCIGRGVAAIRSIDSQQWINFVINSLRDRIYKLGVGSTFPNITSKDLSTLLIPFPPLETQKAIVAEIEAEQALVNANRELIERFEKKIQTVLNRIWGES